MAWKNFRRGNKYHNVKVIRDGQSYDSKKEMKRHMELQIMESAGMIHGLKRQKKYLLIPAQREPDTIGKRGGKHKGALIERECSYIADFVYYDKMGNLHVEDVKGYKDGGAYKVFAIKKKLMLYVHHIKVEEI